MPEAVAKTHVTQTIMRGLEVLRAFRCDPRPLSNAELSARLSLPKATVSRITTTLVALGYLLRIPSSGKFQLAPAVMAFGQAYLAANRIRAIAQPLVEALAAELNVSVGLAVSDRLEMLYIIWCRSPNTMTLRLSAGSVLPMGLSAIGRAYLAVQPGERRRALVARLRQQAGERTPALAQEIDAAIVEYQRHGYVSAFEGVQKNTFGFAVPIVYDGPEQAMSLSCGGAKLRMNRTHLRKSIAPALLRTADRIRRAVSDVDDAP